MPDGRTISRNHLHIWKNDNDIGLPWAYELNEIFQNFDESQIENPLYCFSIFCEYCKIIVPKIQGVL